MPKPTEFKKAYTNTYWVRFSDRGAGCITCGPDEDPVAVAGDFGAVAEIDSLPYPANPVIRRRALRSANDGHCPEFCYSPNTCKGRTACPKNYACSE